MAARSSPTTCICSIRVPNTWYRASMEWPDSANPADPHRLIGVTLPGVPALVTGSNTHIAWGFTNTYADWGDLVELDTDPANPNRYRTPDGWRDFEHFDETMRCHGRARAARGRDVDDLGSGSRARLSWPAARVRLGGALGRTSRHDRHARSNQPARSRKRLTRPTVSARRARTSSSPTAAAASAGPSTARFRGAPASMACCPRHGPTDRAAGTDGSIAPNTRAFSIRPADASGRQTRAWSAATCSRSLATAATRSARVRGRFTSG